MNINSVRTNSISASTGNKQAVEFTATPEDILYAVKKSGLAKNSNRCRLLNRIEKDTRALRKELFKAEYTPNYFTIKLGEINPMPEYKLSAKAKALWDDFQTGLANTAYVRTSSHNPGYEKRVNLGEYTKNLLTEHSAPEPDVITLKKPEKFNLLKFLKLNY